MKKPFLETERCDAYPSIKFHHRQALQSMIPTKIWKVFQTRYAPVENKHLISKQLLAKIDKTQKNWDRQPTKHREKGCNLRSSTYQNNTFPNFRYRY